MFSQEVIKCKLVTHDTSHILIWIHQLQIAAQHMYCDTLGQLAQGQKAYNDMSIMLQLLAQVSVF